MRPVVYLTFDDGPVPAYTTPILDELARKDVHATFFVLGDQVAEHPGLTERLARDGHSVQNHTYNHLHAGRSDRDRFGFDTYAAAVAITERTGVPPTCIRPPYGAAPSKVGEWTGMPVVMWDIDPEDWERGVTAEHIVDHVVSHAYDGAVILLHDGGGNRAATVAAVGPIIDILRAQGYRFGVLCR